MFGRDWEPGEATIIALKEIGSIGRHGGIDSSGAKMKSYEFVADVRPTGGGPVFRTVIHEPLDERTWRRPNVGDVVAVKCDPRREKAKFDTSAATAAAREGEARQAADRAADAARFDAAVNAAPGTTATGAGGGVPASVSRMKEILAQAKADMARDQVAAPGTRNAQPASVDRLDRLAKLADLHDRGVLTDEEFAAEKARILADG